MTSTAIVRLAVSCGVFSLVVSTAFAHPLSKDDAHDRAIVVRLRKGDSPNRILVDVEYRLEAAETTIFRDMQPYRDEIDFLDYFPQRPLEYYALFAKKYEGILADRLIASLDKKPRPGFRCVERKPRLVDEDGKTLGHLRCDFVFETSFDIDPERKTQFDFEDKTYYLEEGKIALSVTDETGLAIAIAAPDASAKSLALDDDRSRQIKVVFAPAPRRRPKTWNRRRPRRRSRANRMKTASRCCRCYCAAIMAWP